MASADRTQCALIALGALLASGLARDLPAGAAAPTCSITGPATVTRGEAGCFTATADDPDGSGIVSYDWEFGGGTRVLQGWWHMYEGDVLPPDAGWSEVELKDQTNIKEIVDIGGGNHALHIVDNNHDKTKYRKYPDTSAGVTVVGRCQFVAADRTAHLYAPNESSNGSYEMKSSWDPAGALYVDKVSSGGGSYGSAPAGVWHTIRTTLDSSGNWALYLDENPTPIASGTGSTTPNSLITIGAASTAGTGEIYYDYLYIANSGAWAPGEAGGPDLAGTPLDASECAAWSTLGSHTLTVTVTDGDGEVGTCTYDVTIENADPVCSITVAPAIPAVGAPATFTAAASDPDGSVVSYAWEFGDGGTGSDNPATHTYLARGAYVVIATVADNDGGSASCELTVDVASQHPACMISGPSTGHRGETLCFTAIASGADGAPIVSYDWDFGDGTKPQWWHQYEADVVPDEAGWVLYDGDPMRFLSEINPAGVWHLNDFTDTVARFGRQPDMSQGVTVVGRYNFIAANAPFSLLAAYLHTPNGSCRVSYVSGRLDVDRVTTGGGATAANTPPGTWHVVRLTIDVDHNWALYVDEGASPLASGETGTEAGYGVTIGTVGTSGGDGGLDLLCDWLYIANTGPWHPGAGPEIPGESVGPQECASWSTDGSKTVALTVTDGNGGAGTCTHSIAIVNASPVCSITVAPAMPPVGGPATFTAAASDPDGSIVSYAWDFGDGGTGSGNPATHAYMALGTYTATATVTDNDGASASCTLTVDANAEPVCVVTGPATGAAMEPVCFSAGDCYDPDGGALTYLWDMGDAPPDIPLQDDSFETGVGWTVYRGSGPPDSFGFCFFAPRTGDYFFGGVTSWGFVSGGVYQQVGGLIPGKGYSAEIWTNSVSWHLEGVPHPENVHTRVGVDPLRGTDPYAASVVWSPDTANQNCGAGPYIRHAVTFTAAQANATLFCEYWNDVGYEWSIMAMDDVALVGVGGTSDEGNACYAYSDPGTYTVTLCVTDDEGTTSCCTHEVEIGPAPNQAPVCDFSWSPAEPTDLDAVQFTDQSTPPEADDAIVDWAWDFGDGSTSSDRNPVHQFADDGTYAVCLTVTDGGRGGVYTPRSSYCCKTVTVANAPPVCSFTGPTSGPVGAELCWTSTSTDPDGAVVVYWWDFGEAGPNLSPAGDFGSGFQPVNQPCGNESGVIGTGWQLWADLCWGDPYSFFDSSEVVCEGEHAQGVDLTTGSPGFYTEVTNLTPGRTYLVTGCIRYDRFSGNYWAEFGCSDADPPLPGGGCTSPDDPYPADPWLFKQDAWGTGPAPGAWYACGPYHLTPQGTSLIVWYRFGGNPGTGTGYADGVAVTEVVTTSTGCHTYATPGTHAVTLTVIDDDGTTNTCQMSVITATMAPNCSITYSPATPVALEPIGLDSQASDPDGGDVAVAWTFGDGGSGSGIATAHTYVSSGTYTVGCTVTDDDGETATCQATLGVATAPPVCSFTWTPTAPCEGEQIDFDGTASSDPDGSIISRVWEFGDGGYATGSAASHVFAAASTYTASLTVIDNEGGSSECAQPIVVRITPDLDWNCQLKAYWGSIGGAPNDCDDYFGVRPGATDGYDPSLDANKPGAPFGNYVYAWFDRPTWGQGAIMHDWRSAIAEGSSKIWGTAPFDTWNVKTSLDQGPSGVFDHCSWGMELPLAAAVHLTWSFGVSEMPPAPAPPDEYTFTLQYKGGVNAKPEGTAPAGVTVPTLDQTWDMEVTQYLVIPLWRKDFQPPNPYCTDLAAPDTARFKIIVDRPPLCPFPLSCFSFAPAPPTTSDVVQFTDCSSAPPPQTITTWEWDFGDGGTSAQQDPTHQYATPGVYTVRLTVGNDCVPTQSATSTAPLAVAATGNDADLQVMKFGPASAAPAEPIGYEIYYRNNGPGWAYEVVVQDVPDVEVWSLAPTSWYLGDLAPGQEGYLFNDGQVAWPLDNGTILTNTANISSDVFDPNAFNNSAAWQTVVTTPVDPNCKLVSPEGIVSPGQALAYTVQYENLGEGAAYFVYVTDTLGPLLDETTLAIADGGTYDPVSRTVIWDIGTLPAHTGGSVGLQVNVRGDASAGAAVSNQATVHFPTAPSSTDTNIVVNYVLNRPPVADITFSPEVPAAFDPVTFDAHVTDPDPDGYVASVVWDFDDGSTGSGEVVTHQFSDNGTYTVICTATDGLGLAASYAAVVTIAGAPPSCDITRTPTSPDTGDVITFNSGGSDPDGVITSVNWDFGDGSLAAGDPATHQYATPGTRTVTTTVCDDDGACGGCAAPVTVGNRPPTCDITGSGASECATLLTFHANASDPDGTIASVAWDFGDGGSASVDPATHSYLATGDYTVTCTATDDYGMIGSCQTTVTVVPRIVSFFLSGPAWHMISLPCDPLDPDPAAVFDELQPYGDPSLLSGSLHRFDAAGEQYKTWYSFAPGEFGGPLAVGEGYWLYVFNDIIISYEACCAPGERAIHFPVAGWYMMGHPQFGNVDIRSDSMQAELNGSGRIPYREAVPGWIDDPLHGYRPTTSGYYQVTVGTQYIDHELVPFEGYWAYVREAGLAIYIPTAP